MKKIFIVPIIAFLLYIFGVHFGSPYIDFYNVEFLHPLYWTLIPITCLLFLCIFLKNIKPRSVFLTLLVFGVIDFLLLSQIPPLCSQIFCIYRDYAAIIISSIFSAIHFVFLLFQNKKYKTET